MKKIIKYKIKGDRMKEKLKKFWNENKFYLLAILIVVIISNYRLPYYVCAPGGVIDISDRIEYEDLEEYNGSLNMLYVTQYEATIPIYLMSYLMSDWDLESIEENQISNENHTEIDKRNKIMLENSINNAIYVAYTTAGKKIEIKEKKNLVIGTLNDIDLKIGDELLQINDKDIDSFEMIKETINNHEIGDILKFKINRDDKIKEVNIEIKDIDGSKGLGVVIMTNYEYETDPEIELNFKKSESGSSGGLMMALSIYSAISGEDILKGRNIAGTGTIDIEGNVGEIGGIKYKIMGAVKNNMDVVLVPSANYEEAKKIVEEKNYDIELVEVNTFNDAIEYLMK